MKNKKDSQTNREDTISFYSKLSKKDLAKLKEAKELILDVKDKYNLSLKDLKQLFIEEGLTIPAPIFNDRLTVLESVVKYLKEEKNLSLHNIADIIGRDQRNIWHIYSKTKKKYSEKFIIKKVEFRIPVSILSNTKLSALEAVISYLKDEFSLNYHEIALLLKRDDRTIWTVYQRARKKNVKTK